MANTLLTPDVIASQALATLYESTVMLPLVYTDVSADFTAAKVGDTVTIRKPATFTANEFTRGSGTGEPQGILTALSANTNVRVRVTTSGTIGSPDPYKVWKALGQRFRRRASWLMSVDANNALRQLGTANVFHAYTESLPAEWADQFFGKQAYESPYMPDTTSSTSATDGIAVVGDFKNYVVARRAGMSVELIQNLVGLTNNRPTGQRGWFAYARIGGGSANDLGFRLLVNT